MARKVVLVLSPAESSGHGNELAVFILLLSRETNSGRKPAVGYQYLGVPETGAMTSIWQFPSATVPL